MKNQDNLDFYEKEQSTVVNAKVLHVGIIRERFITYGSRSVIKHSWKEW